MHGIPAPVDNVFFKSGKGLDFGGVARVGLQAGKVVPQGNSYNDGPTDKKDNEKKSEGEKRVLR
jgi:hypothetical protein